MLRSYLINQIPTYKFKLKKWNNFTFVFITLCSRFFRVNSPLTLQKDKVRYGVLRNLNIDSIRCLDILGAILGLLLSSFLFLILPILIKLDSSGPVFYTQLRVGKNRRRGCRRSIYIEKSLERRKEDRRKIPSYGRLFKIYKFRTMKKEAEKKCGPVWTSDNDPRITSIGRILRYTHLDELPQLFNILKGDMSFVGPKSERPYFANHWAVQIPEYSGRFKIRPGLTGLAQVKTANDYSVERIKKRLEYDLDYCQNGDLNSYIRIMLLTIRKLVFGKQKL